MLEEGATTCVLPSEGTRSTNLTEKWRLQGLSNAHLGHITIAEGRERTWLRAAIRSDMEEAAT